MYNETFLIEAIQTALQNIDHDGGPFGAVVVKDGKVVATSGNRVTSSLDPTAHAEIEAIRKACHELKTYSLKGCDIYASCQPCPMCLSAIYWARLDNLYYAASASDAANAGFDDDFIYHEIALPPGERFIHSEQHTQLGNEDVPNLQSDRQCDIPLYLAPFMKWNDKNDKTLY